MMDHEKHESGPEDRSGVWRSWPHGPDQAGTPSVSFRGFRAFRGPSSDRSVAIRIVFSAGSAPSAVSRLPAALEVAASEESPFLRGAGTRSGRPHPVAYEGFSSYCGITSVDLFRRNPIRVSFSGHSLGIIETVRGGFELGPGRGPRPRSAFVLLPAGKRTDPLRPGSGYVRSEEDRMTGKRDEQTECPRHDDPSRQIHHQLRSSGLTRRLLAARGDARLGPARRQHGAGR